MRRMLFFFVAPLIYVIGGRASFKFAREMRLKVIYGTVVKFMDESVARRRRFGRCSINDG